MANILIVEDEEAINQLIKQNLRLAGHECTQVYDGLAAKQILQGQQSFDLILMDVMLPHIDGFTLMQYVKEIPVIFLTGKNDRESVMKVTALRPEGYLLKSMEAEQIIKAIDDFFEKKKWTI